MLIGLPAVLELPFSDFAFLTIFCLFLALLLLLSARAGADMRARG